jgi:hypothetical protein
MNWTRLLCGLVLLALVPFFVGGCVTAQERADVREEIAGFKALIDRIDEKVDGVKAKIESKDLTISEGLAIIEDLGEIKAEVTAKIKESEKKLEGKPWWKQLAMLGYGIWTLATGGIGAMGGKKLAVAAVREERGPSSLAYKDMNGRITDAGRTHNA